MKSYVGTGAGAYIENQLFSAKEEVLVCSPWISPEFARRLANLARQGVTVRVITSAEAENAGTFAEFGSAFVFPRDQQGRAMLGREPPKILVQFIYPGSGGQRLHAKIYVADGRYAVVGSSNLTHGGLYENEEYILMFEGDEAETVKKDFEGLWRLLKNKHPQGSFAPGTPLTFSPERQMTAGQQARVKVLPLVSAIKVPSPVFVALGLTMVFIGTLGVLFGQYVGGFLSIMGAAMIYYGFRKLFGKKTEKPSTAKNSTG